MASAQPPPQGGGCSLVCGELGGSWWERLPCPAALRTRMPWPRQPAHCSRVPPCAGWGPCTQDSLLPRPAGPLLPRPIGLPCAGGTLHAGLTAPESYRPSPPPHTHPAGPPHTPHEPAHCSRVSPFAGETLHADATSRPSHLSSEHRGGLTIREGNPVTRATQARLTE